MENLLEQIEEECNNYTPSILVIDDDPINLKLMKIMIQKLDYSVMTSNRGADAIEIAKATHPDLILMDIMMPEMNGIETTKKIKATNELKNIPIIFLTAIQKKEKLVEGLESGGVDYITKPFKKMELKAKIEIHIKIQLILKKQNEVVKKLKEALAKVDHLSGLLPICTGCKKIRNKDEKWIDIDAYFSANSDIVFTHTICPSCLEEDYPEFNGNSKKNNRQV